MSLKIRLSTLFSRDTSLIVVFLCVLAVLLWGIWISTAQFTQQFSNRLDAMNVITTALLTLALLGVYVKMAQNSSKQTQQMKEQAGSMDKQANLQEKVTEIQERQQRLMEAQHQPELILQDTFEADADKLILELSNKGTGLAKNIGLDVEFFVNEEGSNNNLASIKERVDEEIYKDDKYGEIGVRRGFGDVSHSLSRSSESNTPTVDAGTVLPAGETDKLTTKVSLWYYSGAAASPGEGYPIPFSQAVRNLQDMGVKVLAYRIKLTYQNILDEDHDPQHLATGAVRISEDPSLQDLLEARHTTGIIDYSSIPVVDSGLQAEFDLPRF